VEKRNRVFGVLLGVLFYGQKTGLKRGYYTLLNAKTAKKRGLKGGILHENRHKTAHARHIAGVDNQRFTTYSK
jgi:hypothetical protein